MRPMANSANFCALLEKRLSTAGDLPAFEMADGKTLSFAQLLEEVGRAAAALESRRIPDFGESIVPVVTAAPGQSPPSEADIISSLSQRLAKSKLLLFSISSIGQYLKPEKRSVRHA